MAPQLASQRLANSTLWQFVRQCLTNSVYEIEASEQNWTLRELRRQFDSGLYERLALSRDKEGIRRLAQEGAGAASRLYSPFVRLTMSSRTSGA
jgi:predicted nuclease of restriction endonuclease-like (RecB) superfamily